MINPDLFLFLFHCDDLNHRRNRVAYGYNRQAEYVAILRVEVMWNGCNPSTTCWTLFVGPTLRSCCCAARWPVHFLSTPNQRVLKQRGLDQQPEYCWQTMAPIVKQNHRLLCFLNVLSVGHVILSSWKHFRQLFFQTCLPSRTH